MGETDNSENANRSHQADRTWYLELNQVDYHTYFVADWDWGFSVWSHNVDCHPDIVSFRTAYGLPEVVNFEGHYTGTVARIQIGGQQPIYGVNFGAVSSNDSDLSAYKVTQSVVNWYEAQLRDPNRPLALRYTLSRRPAFLKHAEFAVLYRARMMGANLSGTVTINVDRSTCQYDNECVANLAKVLDLFGITELRVIDSHGNGWRFTADGGAQRL